MTIFDKEKFKSIRHEKKISLSTIGRLMDKTYTSIYRWDKGLQVPGSSDIRILAQILDVNVSGISNLKELPVHRLKNNLADSNSVSDLKFDKIIEKQSSISDLNYAAFQKLKKSNITLQKTNNMLISNLNRYTHALNEASLIFYIKDADFKYKYVNTEFMLMTDCTHADDLIGKKASEVFNYKDIKHILEYEKKVINDGEKLTDIEIKLPGNNKKYFFLTFILLLSAFSTLRGNTTGDLGKRTKIPSLGMSIRIFSDLKSNPIQFPHSYNLKNGKGKVFELSELWRYKQYCASWKDNTTQVLISEISIATPKNKPLYTSGKVKYLTTNEKSVYWSKKEINEWLNYYIGNKVDDQKLIINTSYGLKVTEYQTNNIDTQYKTYLFTIEARKGVKKIIVIQYKIKSYLDSKKIKDLIYKSLKSTRFYRMGQKSKTYNESKNSKYKNSSSEYKDAKAKVLQNIKNLKNWWYLDSGNFIIATNIPRKSKKDIYKIRTQLDQLTKLYSLFYKSKSKTKAINVVRVFNERDDYIRYVGDSKKWTAGLWMPSKKELVISPINNKSMNKQEKNSASSLNHEAFHQYLHYAANEIQAGPWFNEGHAAFFEEIEFKRNRAEILPAQYQDNMKSLIRSGNIPDINGLLYMGYEQFYSGNGSSSVQNNYTLAWGLIYFLQKGLPYIKSKYASSYSNILPTYYKELIRTKDHNKATAKAWKKIKMKQLTKDFIKFYKSDSMLRKAANNNILKKK
jgi:transcriptional regulator with XRE-family HTH domain